MTQYIYDTSNGNPTQATYDSTSLNQITHYSHDVNQRLSREAKLDGTTVIFAYDADDKGLGSLRFLFAAAAIFPLRPSASLLSRSVPSFIDHIPHNPDVPCRLQTQLGDGPLSHHVSSPCPVLGDLQALPQRQRRRAVLW